MNIYDTIFLYGMSRCYKYFKLGHAVVRLIGGTCDMPEKGELSFLKE